MEERARKVTTYQELEYREYSGVAIGAMGKHNVNGRILVDWHGYIKYQDGLHRVEHELPYSNPGSNSANGSYGCGGRRYSQALPKRRLTMPTYDEGIAHDAKKSNEDYLLSKPELLIFMSPMVSGFALKNKQWLRFYVDDIKPISWNGDAWEHLVYNERQKDLVLTFVENHQRLKVGIDDVITGKGLGLIILLSGPPGTGKTLTAEAVADRSQRPLYYLQAEDLGINATTLGKNIKRIFEMATEWDAIILLDEADVFMAERSPQDIARNELVSIFLRELEYFQGIIFLTTNLLSTIDNAFRSRVNIHLIFDSLSQNARRQLWEKFLARLPNEEAKKQLSRHDLTELGKWELNGREIKNAIKLVRNWCVVKKEAMDLERLEAGIKSAAPQATKLEEGIEVDEEGEKVGKDGSQDDLKAPGTKRKRIE